MIALPPTRLPEVQRLVSMRHIPEALDTLEIELRSLLESARNLETEALQPDLF